MTTPKVTIFDATTGETITRDMNATELSQLQADRAEAEAKAETLEAKAAARQAALDKLGLTADEAAALFG
jgi:regulator of protease activity HflC (stomatin/prohibitin superfamily)